MGPVPVDVAVIVAHQEFERLRLVANHPDMVQARGIDVSREMQNEDIVDLDQVEQIFPGQPFGFLDGDPGFGFVSGKFEVLLAFPLAYNLTLHYGFISFALSLPVVLWLLAQMTKLAHSDRPRTFLARWFATAAVAALLFLCHLQNFLYGVCASLAFAGRASNLSRP